MLAWRYIQKEKVSRKEVIGNQHKRNKTIIMKNMRKIRGETIRERIYFVHVAIFKERLATYVSAGKSNALSRPAASRRFPRKEERKPSGHFPVGKDPPKSIVFRAQIIFAVRPLTYDAYNIQIDRLTRSF